MFVVLKGESSHRILTRAQRGDEPTERSKRVIYDQFRRFREFLRARPGKTGRIISKAVTAPVRLEVRRYILLGIRWDWIDTGLVYYRD